jgi:hypothetical protein
VKQSLGFNKGLHREENSKCGDGGRMRRTDFYCSQWGAISGFLALADIGQRSTLARLSMGGIRVVVIQGRGPRQGLFQVSGYETTGAW